MRPSAPGGWKNDVQTIAGWREVYSLLWGGRGHAPDLDALMNVLFDGLEATSHIETIEVLEGDVRAAAGATSLLDAACLNSIGAPSARPVRFFLAGEGGGREVALPPPVLSALVSEIRLPLERRPGSLLDKADLLDFPGGRALKGINGFGKEELSTGRLELAVEVFKRGKLTFLFEQFALDREITTLLLCSPGPTKPEAIQLQSQVEQWLKIRYGAPVPAATGELDKPSLFLALTKFDTSLGTLRSDNAKDRWESRVQEACVDFWARTSSSWIGNWGGKGRAFTNLFWIRNPYADQMQTVKNGTPDHEAIHRGYLEARAVERHVAAKETKWAAVDGEDERGLPRSGVPLLSAALHDKLAEDVKGVELAQEGQSIARELTGVLRALSPSANDEEARARAQASAEALVAAVEKEMARTVSGEPFGEMIRLLTPPLAEVQAEMATAWRTIAPMSIKTSDKAKKLLVHTLKWWSAEAGSRARSSDRGFPPALLESFARQVCVGKGLLPVLGAAVFPYFSRANLDVQLVARICHVKIGDALLNLGQSRPRATPTGPVRLSYDESARVEAGAIDWNDVSWGDDSGDATQQRNRRRLRCRGEARPRPSPARARSRPGRKTWCRSTSPAPAAARPPRSADRRRRRCRPSCASSRRPPRAESNHPPSRLRPRAIRPSSRRRRSPSPGCPAARAARPCTRAGRRRPSRRARGREGRRRRRHRPCACRAAACGCSRR